MRRQGPRHAGPRRHSSWWRGPWPPTILLVIGLAILGWELSWALSLLNGGG